MRMDVSSTPDVLPASRPARRAQRRAICGDRVVLSALCVIAASHSAGFTRDQTAPAPDKLRQALERDGRVTVLVALDDGAADEQARAHWTLAERKAAFRRAQDACLVALAGSSVRLRYRYRYSPVVAVEVSDAAGQRFLESLPGVRRLQADEEGSGALDESRPMIHADQVHDLGVTGEGCVVAVLDTGVDSDHPDLVDAILHPFAHHFLQQGDDVGVGAEDGHGHGTNVAGIIASRGTVAPLGIAPSARLIPIKVLDDRNRGWFADWAAGLDYAVSLHEDIDDLDLDAINMSLASNALFADECDTAQVAILGAARAARELGIAVFAASGNNFSTTSIAIPACMSPVFAIGSVRDSLPDQISAFTNRNALLDLLAPGDAIESTGRFGERVTISGTSQATPHVTALACLLREVDRTLGPQELLEIMQRTGVPIRDDATSLVFSRIDALAAVSAVLVPEISGLSCSYEAADRGIEARWDAVTEIDALVIAVERDSEEILRIELGAEATAFETTKLSGGEYRICVSAKSGALLGPASCCTIEVPAADEGFRRGECNGDGWFDISDPILTLTLLFVEATAAPPCWRACDSDDDERVNVTDAVYSLRALFQGTTPPPPPFPDCGTDPTTSSPVLACSSEHCT
jgi:subtilisin family serine protease